jgi:L-lactate dehydrogenase complex protein LldF
VCPVKIDIPTALVHLRARDVDRHRGRPTAWGAAMKAASVAMSDAGRFALAEKAGGLTRVLGGRSGRISSLPFPGSLWTRSRDLPVLPKQSFRAWWAAERGDTGGPDGGAAPGSGPDDGRSPESVPASPPAGEAVPVEQPTDPGHGTGAER